MLKNTKKKKINQQAIKFQNRIGYPFLHNGKSPTQVHNKSQILDIERGERFSRLEVSPDPTRIVLEILPNPARSHLIWNHQQF